MHHRYAEPIGCRAVVAVALGMLLALCTPTTARAYNIVEVTFDDGDDGTGPHDDHAVLDNMATNFASLGTNLITTQLTAGARRSTITQGRYGRAADFPQGNGSVEITGWERSEAVFTIYMWVKGRSLASGRVVHIEQTFAIGLEDGQLVVEAGDGAGAMTQHETGANWPADGAYHHLATTIDRSGGQPKVTVLVDGQQVVELTATVVLPVATPRVLIGDGFDGLIDELIIKRDAPGDNEVWSLSPLDCPWGMSCLEEVITVQPTGYPHEVPVRFKSAYDASQCTAQAPCPLLIDISGGGACSNDYDNPRAVRRFAEQGLFVVTIDLYCESVDFPAFPRETSQILAVKEHLRASSPLKDLIAGPDYFASGCSHGCGTVMSLMMFEADHPARTYARSCNPDWLLCGYEAGVLCSRTEDFVEQQVIDLIGEMDYESPIARQDYELTAMSKLSPQSAASREVALSWGVNLSGPVCSDGGLPECFEEGMWAMTYGGRRFRDVWQKMEPAGNPTGYFVQDQHSDCKHCALPGTPAFDCGICLLKHGRQQMASACPECLNYTSNDTAPGDVAEICPVSASWYSDPLTAAVPDAGGPSPDGGNVDDAGNASQTDAGMGSRPRPDNGCGCETAATSQAALGQWPLFVLLVMGLWSRRPEHGSSVTRS